MIENLNDIAHGWCDWMWPMLWQVSLLIALIMAVDVAIRKWAWPQLRHALWLLIVVKLVLPPGLSLPTSLLPHLDPIVESVASPYSGDRSGDVEPPSSGSAVSVAPAPQAPQAPNAAASTGLAVHQPAVSTTDSTATARASLSWQAWLMAAWFLGASALGGCLALRLRRLRARIHACTGDPTLENALRHSLVDVAARLRLSRIPDVRVTDCVAAPAVFGVFRPALLMPAATIGTLSRKDLEHILLHELAHIKRGDLLVHAAFTLLQIVYWFNPLLWMVRRQLQHMRELCCDATVARVLREDTADYRETLLEAGRRLLVGRADPGLGLLGLLEDSGRLVQRLRWLERRTWTHRRWRAVAVVATVTLMLACVVPMARAKPDKRGGKPTESAAATSPAATESDELETRVVQGIRANRDRLKCGVLSWSQLTMENGFIPERTEIVQPTGAFKMWWDGNKLATAYRQDQVNQGADGLFMTVRSGGSSYDGGVLSRKPKLGPGENWLTDVSRWAGEGSRDNMLIRSREAPHLTIQWVENSVGGERQIRQLVKNNEDGARSIEDYDPARGFNLVRLEWYDGRGVLYMRQTVEVQKVTGDVWFPVQVDQKSMNEQGKVTLHHRFVLDLKRCSFNDRSAIPDGIFNMSVGQIQQQYQTELEQAYQAAKAQQSGAGSRPAAEPLTTEAVLRRLISRFADAAVRGDETATGKYLDGRKYKGRVASVIKQMQEVVSLGATPAVISMVEVHGNRALVVSDFFDFADSRYQGKQCLIYKLIRRGEEWMIEDIDLADAKGLVDRIRNFDAWPRHPPGPGPGH